VTPTKDSPSQLFELGKKQIVDQDGSWMKRISKSTLSSNDEIVFSNVL